MNTAAFVIEDGVAIPARVLAGAGPRESMYPVDSLKEGQGFGVSLLTGDPEKDTAEAITKRARQKQSQFSSLARSRKITLVTRFFDGSEGNESPFKSVAAPCLGVWHGGPAKEKAQRKKKDSAAAVAPAPVVPAEETIEL